MPTVSYQYFDGATASMINSGDAVESNLDIQAIASVDPGATIDEYVYPASTDTDTFVAMLTTLSQQTSIKIASFFCFSYGELRVEALDTLWHYKCEAPGAWFKAARLVVTTNKLKRGGEA